MATLYNLLNRNVPVSYTIAQRLQGMYATNTLDTWYVALSEVANGKYSQRFTHSFYTTIINNGYAGVGSRMLEAVANIGITIEEFASSFSAIGHTATANMILSGVVVNEVPAAAAAPAAAGLTNAAHRAMVPTTSFDIGDDTDTHPIPQWMCARIVGANATYIPGFINKKKNPTPPHYIEDEKTAVATFARVAAAYKGSDPCLFVVLDVYRGGREVTAPTTTSHGSVEETFDIGSDEEESKPRVVRDVTLGNVRTANSEAVTFFEDGVKKTIEADPRISQFVIMEIDSHNINPKLKMTENPATARSDSITRALNEAKAIARALSAKNKSVEYVVYTMYSSTETPETEVTKTSMSSVKFADKTKVNAPSKTPGKAKPYEDANSDLEVEAK